MVLRAPRWFRGAERAAKPCFTVTVRGTSPPPALSNRLQLSGWLKLRRCGWWQRPSSGGRPSEPGRFSPPRSFALVLLSWLWSPSCSALRKAPQRRAVSCSPGAPLVSPLGVHRVEKRPPLAFLGPGGPGSVASRPWCLGCRRWTHTDS